MEKERKSEENILLERSRRVPWHVTRSIASPWLTLFSHVIHFRFLLDAATITKERKRIFKKNI